MKKKALSLILGLLVLLTAFSNIDVSAQEQQYYVKIITNDTAAVVDYISTNLAGYLYEEVQGQYVTIFADDLINMMNILRQDLPTLGEIRGMPPGKVVYFRYSAYHQGTGDGTVTFTANEDGQIGVIFSMYKASSGNPQLQLKINGEVVLTATQPSAGSSATTTGVFNVTAGDVIEVYYYAKKVTGDGDSVTAKLYFTGAVTLNSNLDGFYSSYTYDVLSDVYHVTFNLKDALTGQGLTGVAVKENGEIIGTISDGGALELVAGEHVLTFEKSGYWSITKTINVQSDMNVTVEMYPSSAAFQFLNFPSSIEVYENSIYELTFTISPITTDVTYNTYLSISGLSNVLEVKKAGQVITPESGKYYLGDISGDTQISIKFKAGSIGTHSFTVTLTSNDAIMSSTYTTSKQVAYNVIPLPFSVQMPSEWQVGANELRISESSGQTLLITAILKDSQGNEVWSDSASLGPYEAYTFQVNVPSEGTYTLELQFNGQTASWDITVSPAISLLTKTITASEGDIATVQVKINNPSSNTKYYTIVLEGPIIEGNVSKSVSVAPLSEKTVDVSFQVPSELEYDAYDLNIKVYEGDALQYSDIVHLVIDSGGFSLPFFGGGSSSSIDSTWLWLGAGVLALFVIIAALRRR